jgi:CHAT domain-containing protein
MYQNALRGYYSDTSSSESFIWKKNHDIATVQMGIALAMEETNQTAFSYFFNKKALNFFINYYPESVNTVVTAINLCAACNRSGYYDEALYYGEFADSVFNADYNVDELFMVYYYILLEGGTAYLNQKNYELAQTKFKELVKLTEKYYDGDNSSCALPYSKLAESYYRINQPDSSLYYYEKALALVPQDIETNINIAKLYYSENNKEEAIGYLQEALSVLCGGRENEILSIDVPSASKIVDSYSGFKITELLSEYFAVIAAEEGVEEYYKLALSYSMLADTLILKQISGTLSGGNDEVIAGEYHDFAGMALSTVFDLWNQTKDPAYLDYAIHFISGSKAVKLNHETRQSDITQKQIEISRQIRQKENTLMVLSGKENEYTIDSIKEEIFELNLKSFELSMEIKEADNSKEIFADKHLNIEKIKSLLTENEALIAYHFQDSRIYTMLIGKDNVVFTTGEVGEEFDKTVSDYFKQIKTGDKNFVETSAQLYSYLIKPIESNLEDISKLIIIPDLELNQIPFDALVYDSKIKDGFLINRMEISYNFSVDLWITGKSKSDARVNEEFSFMGFAPVFNDQINPIVNTDPLAYDNELRSSYSDIVSYSQLKPLPQSGTEVSEVSRMFASGGYKNLVLTNMEATEKALKDNCGDYRILHIATHGYSSQKNPELSGLYMNASDDRFNEEITNDGFLYSGEIYNMDLQADLVILSACKSGSGKIVSGEGSIALPRAFAYNGVPNTIASLWKIHDTKTKDQMLYFYRLILSGKTYSQALRETKLWQIKNGELPMDWAGMILIGI